MSYRLSCIMDADGTTRLEMECDEVTPEAGRHFLAALDRLPKVGEVRPPETDSQPAFFNGPEVDEKYARPIQGDAVLCDIHGSRPHVFGYMGSPCVNPVVDR